MEVEGTTADTKVNIPVYLSRFGICLGYCFLLLIGWSNSN